MNRPRSSTVVIDAVHVLVDIEMQEIVESMVKGLVDETG